MSKKKLITVIPVYNEADTIKKTIDGLKNIELIDEILIVDDGSTDNTPEIIQQLGVPTIRIHSNCGKGYAMKLAIENAKYDYIAFIDGDLGFTSQQLTKLIKPVVSEEVDFTIAKFGVPKTRGGFGLVKGLARMGVFAFTGKRMHTSLSGQRVYRREVVESIKYMPNNYGIEVAMTIQAIGNGYSFKEIPVDMEHRYSDRSLAGFRHRGRQFIDIMGTLAYMGLRR
ncbi:MAG: glycosyltransferase family 2 protein [Tissierellia bacterium]|nr:glycosyltransferase family 2 protein [Tissierellia bacterium]